MSPTSAEVARHYAQFQIRTASHPKRICMLHARCMELVMMAGEEEPSPARRLLLDKAQNILSQLQAVLRVDDAVSNSLFYIYDYCYLLLARGGKADCSYANQMLAVLRSTFDQLLRNI